MNLKQIGMMALVMALVCVMPALAADTAAPTETTVQTGSLQISISRVEDFDSWSRYVVIAPYGPEDVIIPQISLNGFGDARLKAGKYYVVLPKGYGSGYMMDAWVPEFFDVTVSDGGVTYVTFVGPGR